MNILPQELYDKIHQALNENVTPMGKEFIVLEHGDNEHLYEFAFNIGGDVYNLMRSVELDDSESPDEFDLIYYDHNSIMRYKKNFNTMSDYFLLRLKEEYTDLSQLYTRSLGVENSRKMPQTLASMINSMYYDGDNYFLNTEIGEHPVDRKISFFIDPMLNIETKQFFFRHRYYIGHTCYNTYEDMKAGFIEEFILKPTSDLLKSPESKKDN